MLTKPCLTGWVEDKLFQMRNDLGRNLTGKTNLIQMFIVDSIVEMWLDAVLNLYQLKGEI